MPEKILFLCRRNLTKAPIESLSLSAVFNNEYLLEQGLDSKIVTVFTTDDIIKEVQLYHPSTIIIESIWLVPIEFLKLCGIFPNVRWIIRVHSNMSFLFTEMYGLEWFNAYQQLSSEKRNISVAVNNESFQTDVQQIMSKEVLYLPNRYNRSPNFSSAGDTWEEKDTIDIGCFGALRHLKNHGYQALVAIALAKIAKKKLNFHINVAESEKRKNSVYKNIQQIFKNNDDYNLIEHPWQPHPDFINLVRTMDLGMQMSFSESFNFVVCDFINNGIPIAISEYITWAPDDLKVSLNYINQAALSCFYIMSNQNDDIRNIRQKKLLDYNKKAGEVWSRFFN